MSRTDVNELFERYLEGQASEQEVRMVESWLNDYQNPRSEWAEMDERGREKWLDDVFHDIEPGVPSHKTQKRPARIAWLRWAAAAAAIALLFIGAYLFRAKPAELVAVNVAVGKKSQLLLSDGSKIWVNASSNFEYPKTFGSKTREVYLSGEAYFDIRHEASRPFIIHTGAVTTTVLGTAFDIKEDKEQHTITVTVTRGKVSVANGGHVLGVITPNQQISFNTATKTQSAGNVDAAKTIAWQSGNIEFNDITFADAASELQQRFSIRINFANDKVKNCRFSGSVMKDEKLDHVLTVICAFNNATYHKQADGTILIDGPGCD